jgi:hypothetical protein
LNEEVYEQKLNELLLRVVFIQSSVLFSSSVSQLLLLLLLLLLFVYLFLLSLAFWLFGFLLLF